MKHYLFVDFHWLLSWEVISKFLLIIITAVLGLWNEIREKFSKKVSGKKGRENRIYVYALLFLLVLTLVNEMLNTKKSVNDAISAQHKLDSAETREKKMNSTLEQTMDTVNRSISSLRSLLKITDKLNAEQQKLLSNSVKTTTALKNFSDETARTLPKMQNPINSVRFKIEFTIDHIDPKLIDVMKKVLELRRVHDTTSTYTFFSTDTLLKSDSIFVNLTYLRGEFCICKGIRKSSDAGDFDAELTKHNTVFFYGFRDFSDSTVYEKYYKTRRNMESMLSYKTTKSDKFYNMSYEMDFSKKSLKIISYGNLSYEFQNKHNEITSPLDFQDINFQQDYYVALATNISSLNNFNWNSISIVKLDNFSLIFNNDPINQTYVLDVNKIYKKIAKDPYIDIFKYIIVPFTAFSHYTYTGKVYTGPSFRLRPKIN